MPDASDLSHDRLLAPLPRDRKGLPLLGGVAIVKKLGSGGMGSVYKGVQQSTGRAVAIKILPFTLLDANPGLEKRFLLEARTAAALDSPWIVRVFDVGCERQTHFIVMEYVPGESAGALVRKRREAGGAGLTGEEALRIATAGARGLAAAHAKGIVHRDVKPDNLLIPEGSLDAAKLADLGLAKPEGATQTFGTLAHVAMGTPGFMAPEQAEDARSVGPGSDVFAMGATIYAMVMGEAPFRGSSLMETLRLTSHGNPTPLPQTVSRGLRWIVDKCLAKRPIDRFRDGAELLAALERAAAEPDAIGAPPPKFARPAPTGSRTLEMPVTPPPAQSRAPWIAVAIVAALLALGAVALILRNRAGGGAPKTSGDAPKTDNASQLLARAVQFENDGQFDEALAVLAKAAAEAPDDARIGPMRERIRGRIAEGKAAEEHAQGWRLFVQAAEAARLEARAKDTEESWQRVAEAAGKLRSIAASAEETKQAGDLAAEAAALKLLALAKQKLRDGDLAGAAATAAEARSIPSAPADEIDAFRDKVKKLAEQRGADVRRSERKREFERLASLAAAEKDDAKALDLWREAQAFADDPADLTKARDAADALGEKVAGAAAARRVDELIRLATTALEQGRLDEADGHLKKVREANPGDPRLADLEKRIAAGRAKAEYDAAMAEAAAAVNAKDADKARAAYRKALEALPGDKAATEGLAALGPDKGRIKPVVGPKAIDVTLATGATLRFVRLGRGTTTIGEGVEQRRVTLTEGFAIAQTELTQAQWKAVLPTNPSRHVGDRLPVESITWWDALRFFDAVNERLDGWTIFFPTEAQWEYACRAGTTTEWSFGSKDIKDYAWVGIASGGQTHEVATLQPNPWGLYDMHGNVGEWCYDGNGVMPEKHDVTDWVGTIEKMGNRIFRGGDYVDPGHSKSSTRFPRQANDPSPGVGLRPILVEGKTANPHLKAWTFPLDAGHKMEFVQVRAGTFPMGSARGNAAEKPHFVTLSRDVLVLTTEVTQAQWIALMGKHDFSNAGPDNPADNVSWDDARDFAKKFSERFKVRAGLPTEAEWEFACRGGTEWSWPTGDDVNASGAMAWTVVNAKSAQPVAKLKANAWGLYDMCGNVFEWCEDTYAAYPEGDAVDPAGPKEGPVKVIRGGGWTDNREASASFARKSIGHEVRGYNIGFRIVVRP